MKIICFLLVALFAAILLPAQNKYFAKGKIVTNAGDTISGYIERLRDKLLDDGITFKKEINSKEQRWLTPDSISGFTFTDENRVYESLSISDTTNATIVHEKKFANLLLKGYCSLYILYMRPADMRMINKTDNDHIFLAKKSGSVTVLAELESTNNYIYTLGKQYVYRLKRLFSDCSSIDTAEIVQTGFYTKALKNLFTKYNLCQDPGVVPVTYKTKEKLKFSGTIYVGSTIFLAGKNIQAFWGTDIGIFFSIIHPRINERIALSFGFNYKNFKYSMYNQSDNATENHKVNMIGLPLSFTYHFNNNKIAPFFYFGLAPTFIKENYIDNKGPEVLKGFFPCSSFGPGVNISNIYLSALCEIDNVFLVKNGYFFSFRAGYRF